MKKLIHEIHRRSLWQVLVIYITASWVVLEVTDVLASNFGLPEWFPAFALGLLLLGLPIVLATAFVQEGGPTGGREDSSEPASTVGSEADLARTASEAAADSGQILTWRNVIGSGVLALALWGIVATGWILFGPGHEPGAPLATGMEKYSASVAVLPFANRSSDPENVYFVDGIHDDILTHLAKLDDLKLISRTSVMRYRDTDKSIREIGEELGVAAVLEGGVQRSGTRIRVTVQLIDAATDDHLWAESYDEELTAANVFAIQSDVARQIARALQATLTPEVGARMAQRPTESLEAYDLYVQGRFLLNTRHREGMRSSVDLFRDAIALDPAYASAFVGIADAHMVMWSWDMLAFEDAEPATRAALETALEIDPLLGQAHISRALYLNHMGRRWDDAEREYRKGIELVPGYAIAHHWYAIYLLELGRFDEARLEIRKAGELDPLSLIISTNTGWVEYFARDYEAAITHYRTVLERDPKFLYTWALLADAYSMSGRHEEAIAAARRPLEIDPNDHNYPMWLAFVLARAGQTEEARRLAKQEADTSDPTRVAMVYVALDEPEEAFAWLDRAFAAESPFLVEMAVDPRWDPIRDDPRFLDMVRTLGLAR